MTSGSAFLFICLSLRTLTHCWAKECTQDVQEKVKRDFFITIFCGMKGHRLFFFLKGYGFVLWLMSYSSEYNLPFYRNLLRKLIVNTVIY